MPTGALVQAKLWYCSHWGAAAGTGRVLTIGYSLGLRWQEFFGTADPFADLAWVEYLDEGTGGETERPHVSAPSAHGGHVPMPHGIHAHLPIHATPCPTVL